MMKSILKQKTDQILRKLVSQLSDDNFKELIFEEIQRRIALNTPENALKILFDIDSRLYELEGQASIRYGDGLHTKHKHIKYHDFFIENIPPKSRVLDIGCGNGALASDLADNVEDVTVYGIDKVEVNIIYAKENFARDNIIYVCGDALTDLPNNKFNVIVLSNVLEHIEKRAELLCGIQNRYNPDKFLIRVPIFERDWRVPLKEELGIDYRLDNTHFIEYRQEEFFEEIKKAGLKVSHYKISWGEIWAVVKQSHT